MTSVQLLAADWPAPKGIIGGTTLRTGGVSRGSYASLNLAAHVGDEAGLVHENRTRFVTACGLPRQPQWLAQVHGTKVVREGAHNAGNADAIISSAAGRVCAVLTADCLPVLFVSDDGQEVAAAHAGWRGLCDGVLEATVKSFHAVPDRLMAWFGPAISQAAFEVGSEVRDGFLDSIGRQQESMAACFEQNAHGRWQADLYRLAALRLENCGVTRTYGGGRCTFNEPDAFFSHRRDGPCGRMATFVTRV